MKNDLQLYKAIGKADDAMVKDALENGAVKNHRISSIMEAVASVAIICGFVALSIVLQSISRPDNNIAMSSSGETEEETVQKTKIAAVEATETEAETVAETEKSHALDFLENPVVWCSADQFYKIEPYKYFMPEKIPENFVNYVSSRWVAGKYLCTDGEYHTVNERAVISLRNSTVNNGNDYIELDIIITQLKKSEIDDYEKHSDPVKLSVDNVESGEFSAAFEDGIYKTGIEYFLSYSAEGYLIDYHYKVYPSSIDDQNSRQYLYDIVTSAQYFKNEDGSIIKQGQLDDNSVVIFNENAVSMINKVYGHPGTSDMKLKLNQTVTAEELEGYKRISLGGKNVQYYDPDYTVKPMYYSWDDENRLLTDEEIAQRTDKDRHRQNGANEEDLDDDCDPDWYEGSPYIRYEVNKYGKEQRVVHVDIVDENISVCGLTVNSSLDEAEKVLKELGFEVNRGKMNFTYGYGTDREYIYAKADGFWIVFETSSEFKGVSRSAYPYVDYLNYKDNIVPAVIRMGMDYTYVASDTHNEFSHTEQFDLL